MKCWERFWIFCQKALVSTCGEITTKTTPNIARASAMILVDIQPTRSIANLSFEGLKHRGNAWTLHDSAWRYIDGRNDLRVWGNVGRDFGYFYQSQRWLFSTWEILSANESTNVATDTARKTVLGCPSSSSAVQLASKRTRLCPTKDKLIRRKQHPRKMRWSYRLRVICIYSRT